MLSCLSTLCTENILSLKEFDIPNLCKWLVSYKYCNAGLHNTYRYIGTLNGSSVAIGLTIDYLKETIRFCGETKVIEKLLDEARNYTIKIPYFENSRNNPKDLELPSLSLMKDKSIKACIDRVKYISPVPLDILTTKLSQPGYWLLQGPPGTGKTSYINLLITIKLTQLKSNDKIGGVYLVNQKTDLNNLLREFQDNPSDEKWFLILEEFDRHLIMDSVSDLSAFKVEAIRSIPKNEDFISAMRSVMVQNTMIREDYRNEFINSTTKSLHSNNLKEYNTTEFLNSFKTVNLAPCIGASQDARNSVAVLLAQTVQLFNYARILENKNLDQAKDLYQINNKTDDIKEVLSAILETIHMISLSYLAGNLHVYLTTNSDLPESVLKKCAAAIRDCRINVFYIDVYTKQSVKAHFDKLPRSWFLSKQKMTDLIDTVFDTKFDVPVRFKILTTKFKSVEPERMIEFMRNYNDVSTLNKKHEKSKVVEIPTTLPNFQRLLEPIPPVLDVNLNKHITSLELPCKKKKESSSSSSSSESESDSYSD